MPSRQSLVSFTRIRDYAERWTWTDPQTNTSREGIAPPANALNKHRKPFHLRCISESGKLIEGDCITLRVNTELHTREVMFLPSREIRQVSDLLIIDIDNVRFFVH